MTNSDAPATFDPAVVFAPHVPPGPPEMDKEALEIILHGQPDGQVMRRWRLALRMTPGNLASVLRYSRRHIIRLEQGDWRITDHFLKRLREFASDLPDPLPIIPPGVAVRARPPLGNRDLWVPITRVAERGEWRECAGCHQEFYFTDKRKLYHSRSCKEAARERGESVGKQGNLSKNYRPRMIRCPNCGAVHPMAGSLVKEARDEQIGRADQSSQPK